MKREKLIPIMLAAFTICESLATTCVGQEYKEGDEVIALRDAELKTGQETVGSVRKGDKLTVEQVRGKWLWVRSGETRGWMENRNVEAVRLTPESAEAHFSRGIDWLRKGDQDRAIASFNEAIGLDPRYADAYLSRGRAYMSMAKTHFEGAAYADKAIADFGEVIRLKPDDWSIREARGDAYEWKKDFTMAVADYGEVIRLNPTSPSLHYKRGAARLDGNLSLDEAVRDFTKVIELDRENRDAYELRGIAFERKGDAQNAQADYASAERLALSRGWLTEAKDARIEDSERKNDVDKEKIELNLKPGDEVVALRNVELKVQAKTVGTARKGERLTVEDIRGDWLWVRRGDTLGWIDTRSVLNAALMAWYQHLHARSSVERGGRTRAKFNGVMFEIINAGSGPGILENEGRFTVGGREIPPGLLVSYPNVSIYLGKTGDDRVLSMKFPGGSGSSWITGVASRKSYGSVARGDYVFVFTNARQVFVNGEFRRPR